MILRIVERLNVLICQALLLAIVISVFADVVKRYVMNSGFLASGEFVPYLFTWFAFLAAALCFRRNEHFAVDVVVENVGRFRPMVLWVIRIAELVTFGCLIYYGLLMAMAQMGQKTPYLQMPYGIVYLSVPVSSVFMLVYGLSHVAAMLSPKPAEPAK